MRKSIIIVLLMALCLAPIMGCATSVCKTDPDPATCEVNYYIAEGEYVVEGLQVIAATGVLPPSVNLAIEMMAKGLPGAEAVLRTALKDYKAGTILSIADALAAFINYYKSVNAMAVAAGAPDQIAKAQLNLKAKGLRP